MNEFGAMDDLYRDFILDHYRNPRNAGTLPDPDATFEDNNPLCGDKIRMDLKVEDGKVTDVRFAGRGCAISMASASLMTEIVKGKSEAEARALFESFHDEMTGKSACHGAAAGELDKLTVLSGVREYPMRVKCATLSWHTLMAALNNAQNGVSTESDDRL